MEGTMRRLNATLVCSIAAASEGTVIAVTRKRAYAAGVLRIAACARPRMLSCANAWAVSSRRLWASPLSVCSFFFASPGAPHPLRASLPAPRLRSSPFEECFEPDGCLFCDHAALWRQVPEQWVGEAVGADAAAAWSPAVGSGQTPLTRWAGRQCGSSGVSRRLALILPAGALATSFQCM
eukprot:359461-Chlamydomonas_euryale.AAC.2